VSKRGAILLVSSYARNIHNDIALIHTASLAVILCVYRHKRPQLKIKTEGKSNFVAKSAKAVLREQAARRTKIPHAERKPVLKAKRSGEQLLANN